jgi:probable HAF family extracellular repeat protein
MRHVSRLIVLAASAAAVLAGVGAASPARAQEVAKGRWVVRELGTFGTSFSEAVAINDLGQVVCNAWEGGPPKRYTAFLWQNGKRTKLTLGGRQSEAAAINEHGQVVGWRTRRAAPHTRSSGRTER